jgi:hypothetical protein
MGYRSAEAAEQCVAADEARLEWSLAAERSVGPTLGVLDLLLALALVVDARSDEFARYPAERALEGAPAPPKLSTPKARRFRTLLRRAAAEGPNFNGHYRVTHWGQGSNIIEWAVIDLGDGSVWFAPEPDTSCWAPFERDVTDAPDWYEIHVESALLYLHACRLDDGRTFDTRYVYVWERGAARLIRTDALPRPRRGPTTR